MGRPGRRVLLLLGLVATAIAVPGSPVAAASTASIGAVTTGTRPGSEVGRTTPTLPTLQYCITYTTTDQARDYGYEVLDAAGVRPPFGSAFTRQFDFVPATEWAAGERLTPRTLCNTVTLEPGRTYTVRAWVTSGPLDTRGSWALAPASAPTAASYTHVTVDSTTTTTTPPSREPRSPGSGDGNAVTCPPTAPVRVTVNGSVTCVALDIYCRSNPGWSDPARGLTCPRDPNAPGQGTSRGPSDVATPACNATASAQRAGRVSVRLATTVSLARRVVRVEVFSRKKWHVVGAGKVNRRGVGTVSTNSRVINNKRTYRLRATIDGRVVCTGSLVVPARLNLRGPTRPA